MRGTYTHKRGCYFEQKLNEYQAKAVRDAMIATMTIPNQLRRSLF